MDDILRGLDFCFAYLDDVLVFSQSLEQHEQHLRALFDQLQKYGILIYLAKSFEHPRSPSSIKRCSPRVPNLWKNERPISRTAILPRPPVSSVDFWAC
jgi:hypothetical protein